jgi:hypothetical protein
VYTGAKEQTNTEMNQGHEVVVGLLQLAGLSGFGYHVYVDNLFCHLFFSCLYLKTTPLWHVVPCG